MGGRSFARQTRPPGKLGSESSPLMQERALRRTCSKANTSTPLSTRILNSMQMKMRGSDLTAAARSSGSGPVRLGAASLPACLPDLKRNQKQHRVVTLRVPSGGVTGC